MAPPTPASAPETRDTSPPWALATPSASVVIMRAPESVNCDSGPTCASENGRYSRTEASTPATESTTDEAMLFMPSMKVESSRAPLSKRLRPPKNSSTAVHAVVMPASREAPKFVSPPIMAAHSPETRAWTFAQAPLTTLTTAFHFSSVQAAMPLQRAFHQEAISSQFAMTQPAAAASAMTAVITSPMGLARMAALSSHCAAVQAFVTTLTASTAPRQSSKAALAATTEARTTPSIFPSAAQEAGSALSLAAAVAPVSVNRPLHRAEIQFRA